MNDYKPNSHRAKAEEHALAEKKVEKVISGTAKVKKKNGARKVADAFISEDAANVKSYILMDVIVPTLKDLLFNVIKDTADVVLFGGSKHNRGRSNTTNSSYVSYNRFADTRTERRYESNSAVTSRFNFENIFIETKGEAEDVLTRMDELIDTYGMVTVSDLCELVGISSEFTDNKYGWTNLGNARAVRTKDGYILDLPRVKVLK
jgi:hypothetical protein